LSRSPVNSQQNPLLEFSKEKEEKKMHTKRAIFMVAIVVGLIWGIPFAIAGEFYSTTCVSGKMTPIISIGRITISTTEYRGNSRSNTSDDFFDTTVHCVGLYLVNGGEVTQTGYCECLSSDGSIYVRQTSGNDQGGTSKIIYGTGKFEGIEGGGTWKFTVQMKPEFPGTFNNCSDATGTYNLPK
jgi:hypothetical protein